MVRSVVPGSAVMTGASATPLFKLYDPNRLQVRVDVPLSTAAKVGVDQEAEIVVDVLPDQVFRGKVLRVVHEADIQRNTLQFKVAIDAPSALLKPEMLARVRFLAPRQQAGPTTSEKTFAPTAAVGTEPGRSLNVWVADLGRNVARQRAVVLGAVRLEQWMEVRSGLSPGDRIIVSPATGLRDGQKIRLKGESSHGSD
jgi:RND family efflux transporter MFP subunit